MGGNNRLEIRGYGLSFTLVHPDGPRSLWSTGSKAHFQERPLPFLDVSLLLQRFIWFPHPISTQGWLWVGRRLLACLAWKEWQREGSCDIPAGLGAAIPDWPLGGAPDMFL